MHCTDEGQQPETSIQMSTAFAKIDVIQREYLIDT